MRISNNMITNNYLYSLNNALERQSKTQEQLDDGKAIHRASDDPLKAIRALRFNTNLTMNEQYNRNVGDALSWMDTTDGVMQDMNDITSYARSLIIKAATPLPDVGYAAIGKDLDGVINQMIRMGNTKIGDRYVFAGQKDDVQPFNVVQNNQGLVARVEYKGDNGKVTMVNQGGLAEVTRDSVNITGLEMFGDVVTVGGSAPGESLSFLNDLINLRDSMLLGTPDQTYLSSTGLKQMDVGMERILSARTALGTRMATYTMTQNLLENHHGIIETDVAKNEDIDMAQVYVKHMAGRNTYEAALAVGAKIMQRSLVDFLN